METSKTSKVESISLQTGQEGSPHMELSETGKWLVGIGRKLDEVGGKETKFSHSDMWKAFAAETILVLGGGLLYAHGCNPEVYLDPLIDQLAKGGYYQIDLGEGANRGMFAPAEQLARNFIEGAVSAESYSSVGRQTLRLPPENIANVAEGLRKLSEIKDETTIKLLGTIGAGWFPLMVNAARDSLTDKSGQKIPISTILQGVGKVLEFIGKKI